MALDAHLFRIDCFVCLEIIQRAAGSPRPGAQCAPVVELARLSAVREANDPRSQPSAIVRLDGGREEHSVTPALCQNLLLPGGTWRDRRRIRPPYSRRPDESKLHNH